MEVQFHVRASKLSCDLKYTSLTIHEKIQSSYLKVTDTDRQLHPSCIEVCGLDM
jgi:hypothetical protein